MQFGLAVSSKIKIELFIADIVILGNKTVSEMPCKDLNSLAI